MEDEHKSKQSKIEMSTTLKTMVVMGSTRTGRMGSRVGQLFKDQLKARTGVTHEIDYVDLAEVKLGFMDVPYQYLPPGAASPELEALAKRVAAADCYIFISPEVCFALLIHCTSLTIIKVQPLC